MTLVDLKRKLEELGDNDYIISYNEGYKTGGFVIDTFHGIWRIIFIDERGNQVNEEYYNSENELCIDVLKKREKFHQSREFKEKELLETPKIILL